jgi:hypothetical protein
MVLSQRELLIRHSASRGDSVMNDTATIFAAGSTIRRTNEKRPFLNFLEVEKASTHRFAASSQGADRLLFMVLSKYPGRAGVFSWIMGALRIMSFNSIRHRNTPGFICYCAEPREFYNPGFIRCRKSDHTGISRLCL